MTSEEQYKAHHKNTTLACTCGDCMEFTRDRLHRVFGTPEQKPELRQCPKCLTMKHIIPQCDICERCAVEGTCKENPDLISMSSTNNTEGWLDKFEKELREEFHSKFGKFEIRYNEEKEGYYYPEYEMSSFWISKIHSSLSAYKLQMREKVEGLKVKYINDNDHYVNGQIGDIKNRALEDVLDIFK
jgi:hypothetical protein